VFCSRRVQALAALPGGRGSAQSGGIGLGAAFTIRPPRAASPAEDAGSPATPSAGRPRRILVVDDNRDAADMLAALLTTKGHHVRVAYDGVTALQEAAAFHP